MEKKSVLFAVALLALFHASCSDNGIQPPLEPSSSSQTPRSSSSSSSLDCSVFSSSSTSEDLCLDFDPDAEIEHYGKMKKQFCDKRDGKKYAYVQIGEQTWMAENLNFDICGSKCGDTVRSNFVDINTEICDKYGRLYDRTAALTICPDGWHLPSDSEWTTLTNYIGGNPTAGTKLKAMSDWVVDFCLDDRYVNAKLMRDYINSSLIVICGVNGTDDYGFSALPGGYGCSQTGRFYDYGLVVGPLSGNWWIIMGNDRDNYYDARSILYAESCMFSRIFSSTDFLSVRCVKDIF